MEEEEQKDGLTQTSFVIPCARKTSKARGKQASLTASEQAFSKLSQWERDGKPAELRGGLFKREKVRLERLFRDAFEEVSAPSISKIVQHVSQANDSASQKYWIPGPPSLLTALIAGPLLSARLTDSIKEAAVRNTSDGVAWVELLPRECLDLASTWKLIVTRALKAASFDVNLLKDNDLDNPASLLKLGTRMHVYVFVHNFATFHYGIFNDIVQGIHSLAQMPNAPKMSFILAAGQSGERDVLFDKLAPETLPLLDAKVIHMDAPVTIFERIIDAFYLREEAMGLWPGPLFLDHIRHQFFESKLSVDYLQHAIELAAFQHYSVRPFSALQDHSSCSMLNPECWKPEFLDRLRVVLINGVSVTASTQDVEAIQIPPPVSVLDASDKQQHLRKLLQDDQYMLQQVQSFTDLERQRREMFRLAVRLMYLLQGHLGLRSTAPTNVKIGNAPCFGPRQSTLGGLTYAMLDLTEAQKTIQGVRQAVRLSSIDRIEEMLDAVVDVSLLAKTKYAAELQTYQREVEDLLLTSESDEENAQEAGNQEDGKEEKNRFNQVQKRLVREEAGTASKRRIADWLAHCLRDLCGLNSIVDDGASTLTRLIWQYNHVTYVEAMTEPSPRSNMLIALDDPYAYLGKALALNGGALPDICHAYRTYQSAGVMINLADWFDAFRLQLEQQQQQQQQHHQQSQANAEEQALHANITTAVNGLPVTPKKNRPTNATTANGRGISSSNHNTAEWYGRRDVLQTRFALALYDLGQMGFLKRTKRKAEHMLKIIHDLPFTKPPMSASMEAAAAMTTAETSNAADEPRTPLSSKRARTVQATESEPGHD